jgi:hypothetical protein
MGDINMDMSESALFRGVTYTCAAIGAVTGGLHFGGGIVGTLIAGTAGAAVGGVCLPAAGVLVGAGVYALGKALIKSAKEVTPFMLLGTFAMAASSAKALFVTPYKSLRRMQAQKNQAKTAATPPATQKKSVYAKISGMFTRTAQRPETTIANKQPQNKPNTGNTPAP